MTVMETPEKSAEAAQSAPPAEKSVEKPVETSAAQSTTPQQEQPPKKENIFSDANLPKNEEITLGDTAEQPVTITSADKVSFVDSVVSNTRFTKSYVLFGGKVTLTLRSLTTDEVNALSAWIIKRGAADSSGLLSGRYRKYLAAAQVARLNDTDMPPLEDPLFETLENDGKTVQQPGWLARSAYWDDMAVGLFETVMARIKEFDALYSALYKKAADVNFWNPDTP